MSGGAAFRVARIPASLLESVVDAAREALPNEATGLLAASAYAAEGGVPSRYVPLVNASGSPYRYSLDPDEQLRVMTALDQGAELLWAIVHSHVASSPVPSPTDVDLAFYPDSLHVICSLAGEVPEVRAWSIRDGVVREVPLAVV